MSLNKKSLIYLVILLLFFFIIYILSTLFFGEKHNTAEHATTVQQELSTIDTNTNNDDHTYQTATVTETGIDAIATKGRVHTLNVPAIYGQRSLGNPSAPIKIQEFFSLTCNHCADFHKNQFQEIKKNYIDTGKVYFTYHEFPLNGPALYGSMTARCLPENRYEGFMDILLRQQDNWAFSGDFKSALLQNAKLAGMTDEEFETCFNNKELQQSIAAIIKESSDIWKINSTPSFVINNGEYIIYGGKSYENFVTIFNHLLGEPVVNETSPSTTTDPSTVIPVETDQPSVSETPGKATEIKSTILDKATDRATDTLDDIATEGKKPLE